MNLVFFKIKSLVLPLLICLFILLLLLFSSSTIIATKSGLFLWANSVLPSLLPFFIATELLNYTNVVSWVGKLLKRIMKPLFNVSGEGAFPFIIGIISGYPIGAKVITNLKKKKVLSDIECERLISFTNNSSLLFILGTIGIGLFNNIYIGVLLLITHLLSCISVGIIFRWWKKSLTDNNSYHLGSYSSKQNFLISFSNLGEVLANSIISAINTCLMICGFIVFFSVLISMFEKLIPFCNIYVKNILAGILELTHGINNISVMPYNNINIIICAFLLGFGGISVFFQVFSITSKANISIKPYIIGKVLQGTLAAFYTFLHFWFTS